MNCFIHNKESYSTYCKICKRPICKICSGEDEICPRCSNFRHSTLMNYNKKCLKLLIPLIIIRFIIFWDTAVVYFFSDLDYKSMFPTGIVLLTISTIPFINNVIKNGFINAAKYQITGKTDPIIIADNKSDVTPITIISAVLSLIVTFFGFLVTIPLFIITDIIHLIIALKQYFYHKKRFEKIKNI